ncbi:hypothetical protein JCM5296_004382 [Sporobolomyces johnsonii]
MHRTPPVSLARSCATAAILTLRAHFSTSPSSSLFFRSRSAHLNSRSFEQSQVESDLARLCSPSRQRHLARQIKRSLAALVRHVGDSSAAWQYLREGARQDVKVTASVALNAIDHAHSSTRCLSIIAVHASNLTSSLQPDLFRRVRHDRPTGSTPRPKARPQNRLLPIVGLDASDCPASPLRPLPTSCARSSGAVKVHLVMNGENAIVSSRVFDDWYRQAGEQSTHK